MSGQFKVGDIAILQNCFHLSNEGRECEIIELPGHMVPGRYVIRTADGEKWHPEPHQLRKKPPPQSTDEWAESKVKDLLRPVPELTEVA
jgi:hypothetical protein